jgi:hypothetical protein
VEVSSRIWVRVCDILTLLDKTYDANKLVDVDLVTEKRFFHLGPKKDDFMKQVTLDAQFLAELQVMDYSLLVVTQTI